MTDGDRPIPNVLAIAGSDPSGGAGIQADLKAVSACGAYGAAAITALTAQNTRGVRGVELVDPGFVRAQVEAVLDDVRIDAVKVGMVATAAIATAVADVLEARRPPFVVVDPVMVARSGDRLLAADAVEAVRDRLLPLADVLTPNLPEAADLLDRPVAVTRPAMPEVAEALRDLGPRGVLLKGGHLGGDASDDVYVDADGLVELPAARIDTPHTHGAGCTLSSAVAALRPRHRATADAVREARAYVLGAILRAGALSVGTGHGPVHHFHDLWTPTPA